jgi:hypothetical protein
MLKLFKNDIRLKINYYNIYSILYIIIMNTFEVDDQNDLSIMITKYEDLYLKELSYYGTSNTNQMFLLISIGQTISKLENTILEKYYTPFVSDIKKNCHISEIYYLQKIIFGSFNIVLKMVSLLIENKIDCEEFEFKKRYLVGMIENFIEKIIEPVFTQMNFIIKSNKIFQIENSIGNLKKFINLNKNKFTSKEKLSRLEKFIRIIC